MGNATIIILLLSIFVAAEDTIQNTLKIIDYKYDTTDMRFWIHYDIGSIDLDKQDVEIGIVVKPGECDTFIIPSANDFVLEATQTIDSIFLDSTYFRDGDSLYCISVWMRETDNPWATPTDSSKILFVIPDFFLMPVKIKRQIKYCKNENISKTGNYDLMGKKINNSQNFRLRNENIISYF